MKTLIVFFVFFLIATNVNSQYSNGTSNFFNSLNSKQLMKGDDKTDDEGESTEGYYSKIKSKILKSNYTPAFAILDAQATSIEVPSDPVDLAVFINSQTQNFTVIPKNFAVEFPLKTIIGVLEPKSMIGFQSLNPLGNTRISIATITDTSSSIDSNDIVNSGDLTKFGIGFRTNIIKKTDNTLKSLTLKNQVCYNIFEKVNDAIKNINKGIYQPSELETIKNQIIKMKSNGTDLGLKLINIVNQNLKKEVGDKILKKEQNIDTLKLSEIDDPLKLLNDIKKECIEISYKLAKEAENNPVVREGIFLDLTAAMAFDVYKLDFNNSQFKRLSAWLDFGWVIGNTVLDFNLKFNNEIHVHSNESFVNIFSNDFGMKMYVPKDKFNISGEIIWRWQYRNKTVYKYLFTIGYMVGDNEKIAFNYGRDFNGAITKVNNLNNDLIASLNLALGFGSLIPFLNKP